MVGAFSKYFRFEFVEGRPDNFVVYIIHQTKQLLFSLILLSNLRIYGRFL